MTEPAAATATLILHFDLNKTVLAVDEVKGFGREEIVYLEEFKADGDFLAWAAANKSDGSDAEAYIKTLKESKNEPELIKYAKEYAALDADRLKGVEDTLNQVRPDNSCESFWELLKWAKEEQSDEKVLVVFRTFGTDMPEMFERCEANGFADDVMRAPDGTLPLIWTMMHELPTEDAAEYTPFKGTKDTVVDGAGRELLQPGPPLPGPKEKGTDEFKLRSVGLEDAGTAFFKAGKQLAPFVFTGPPRIERDAGGIPRLATLTTEDVATYVPVPACQALGVNGTLGKMGFENGSKLKIMGVQDNYKPWSRRIGALARRLSYRPRPRMFCRWYLTIIVHKVRCGGLLHPGALRRGERRVRRGRQAVATEALLGRGALLRRRGQHADHLHRAALQKGQAVGGERSQVLFERCAEGVEGVAWEVRWFDLM